MIRLLEYNKDNNMDMHSDCASVFYLQGGCILKSIGFDGKHSFVTKFFSVVNIDKTSGCLVLRLLQPYKKCSKLILIPSETCIVIDKDCICGSQTLPDIPIKKITPIPICIKDCICGPFAILPGYDETVLWSANIMGSFSGTLKICFEEGFKEGLGLKVFRRKQRDYKMFPICDKEQHFSFKDCTEIVLIRTDSLEKVKGIFEIEVCGDIDDEFVSSFL